MADRTSAVVDPVPKARKRVWIHITALVSFIVFLLAAAAFTVFAIYFHRAEPILKKRVIETLATRFDSRVELDTFSATVWHGLEVSGGGLKLYPNQLQVARPLFSADKFMFRASWRDLLLTPMHIGEVHISGLSLYVPPKTERSTISGSRAGGAKRGKIAIRFDRMDIDHATLVIGTNKPGKVPLTFQIGNLGLTSSGAGKPLRFHAILVNPKPIGDIDSTGTFGPFNEHSPSDTPVTGHYRFSHADLFPLAGIGGTLSSTGQYYGTLSNIIVDGETDTPNFSLDTARHPMPLHTRFHAIVDGMNGDTHLLPVQAELLHSHIMASGDVVNVPGKGHKISLSVSVAPARIEDLLELGVRSLPPAMTGALTLHTKLEVPPGKETVTRKLRMQGHFWVTGAHYTDPKVQDRIDELSLRGQGHARQAQRDKELNIEANIASDMQGHFVLDHDKVTITGLRYTVPGAVIAMNGFYRIDNRMVNFHGTARLQAKVSQMVTGWKSLLLLPVNPFFSKNGAGTEVPIAITGTRSTLHFGLDFHHSNKRDNHRVPDGNRIP